VKLVWGLAQIRCSSSDPPEKPTWSTPVRGCPKVEVIIDTTWVEKGRYGLIGYEQEDTMSIKLSGYIKWI